MALRRRFACLSMRTRLYVFVVCRQLSSPWCSADKRSVLVYFVYTCLRFFFVMLPAFFFVFKEGFYVSGSCMTASQEVESFNER